MAQEGGIRDSFQQNIRNQELTSQRVEILSIILAFQKALERRESLRLTCPIVVSIQSDSKYIVLCMTDLISTWHKNGWKNHAGQEILHLDLFRIVYSLEERVKRLGFVRYGYIPKQHNTDAHEACSKALDHLELNIGIHSAEAGRATTAMMPATKNGTSHYTVRDQHH